MFEIIDKHYIVQKGFEAGSMVILWHPNHTSGMQIIRIAILETIELDGLWKLRTWEFKDRFEDVPHPLPTSYHRTLGNVGACTSRKTLVWPTSNMHIAMTFTELGP